MLSSRRTSRCCSPSARKTSTSGEKHPGILHEDEAAALLYKAAAGKNIHGTEPKEGKIELIADCDGLLKIDRTALLAVNRHAPDDDRHHPR